MAPFASIVLFLIATVSAAISTAVVSIVAYQQGHIALAHAAAIVCAYPTMIIGIVASGIGCWAFSTAAAHWDGYIVRTRKSSRPRRSVFKHLRVR